MDVHPAKLKVVADCTVEEAKAAVSVWGSHMHRRIPCMGTVWADDQCLHQYNLADGRQITMHPWQIIVRPEGTGEGQREVSKGWNGWGGNPCSRECF